MSPGRHVPLAWLAAVALLAPAGMLRAQQPPVTPAAPGTGSEEAPQGRIAGMVVSAKTGEILSGVTLTLRGMTRRGPNTAPPVMRQATTGIDGRFAFEELPTADYFLIPRKAGYGAQNMFRSQMRVRLGAAGVRDDIVLRLQPSAVITGRVFDAYGEPLPEAQVYAITRRASPGRAPQRRAVGRARTNDLGEYRLHGLDTGKYVLVAQPPRATNPRGVGYSEFAPSYYPNGNSLDQATALKLSAGDELGGVDFRLELSPPTTVRGIVAHASTGEPCANCGLQFNSDGVMGFGGLGVRPTEEGIFEVHGLSAGVQSVMIQELGGRNGGRRRPVVYFDQFQVPAGGEVEVALAVGAAQAVSGEIIVEGAPEPEEPAAEGQAGPARQGRVMFALESLGAFPFSPDRAPVPPQSGPFEFPEISPGDYRIQLYGPGGVYLRSVTLGGRELASPRVTVASDGPVTGLTLYIAFGGASISGVVKPASGQQITETQGEQVVILVPDDPNSYARHTVARVQPDGSFSAAGLAPATYTVFTAPNANVDFEDPDLRGVLKPYTKKVTLKKDEQARLELAAVPESVDLW